MTVVVQVAQMVEAVLQTLTVLDQLQVGGAVVVMVGASAELEVVQPAQPQMMQPVCRMDLRQQQQWVVDERLLFHLRENLEPPEPRKAAALVACPAQRPRLRRASLLPATLRPRSLEPRNSRPRLRPTGACA